MNNSKNDACLVACQTYFNTVTHIIQQGVIYGFPDVAHGPLHVAGGDDFVGPRCVFVGGEDPDLSSGNFFFMNVHSLSERQGWNFEL